MTGEIKVLGFNFTKVLVEKHPDFKGKVEVKSNVNIINLSEHPMDLVKEKSLKVDFAFTVSYDGLGELALEGNLFLLVDSKMLKETLEAWKKSSKDISPDLRAVIVNIILQKTSIKALELEEDLNLPLHMPMPRMQFDKA